MSQERPSYEYAAISPRSADFLAREHGHMDVASFAESLPPHARVLDVGAGTSPFGKEVAALRPDIHWTNFDLSYDDPSILEEASRDAPPNVTCVQGDATQLAELYGPETFDTVVSYWVFAHLSLDDDVPARQAAEAIFSVTRQHGRISIGPTIDARRPLLRQAKGTFQVIKQGDSGADYASQVVEATRLQGMSRSFQRATNRIVTPTLGTKNGYTGRDEEGNRYIYHSGSGDYVPFTSAKGVHTLGRLALATAKYAIRQHRSQRKS